MSSDETAYSKQNDGMKGLSASQSERIEASNQATGELDFSLYAQGNNDEDSNVPELDLLTDFDGISLDNEMVMPEVSPKKEVQADQPESDTTKQSHQVPAKKLMSTKNKIAVGLVTLIVVAIGYPIISEIMSSSGSEQPAISNDFVAGNEFNDSVATNGKNTVNGNQIKSQSPIESELLRSEIEQVKLNTEQAFVLVQQKLIEAENKSRQQQELFMKELTELKSQYKHLSDSGTNQIVDQGQKIEELTAMNKKLQATVQSLANDNKKTKAKEKAENEKQMTLALRAKYEVITVISGKARIRNVNTGSELNIENGDEIDGFGKIKDIAITGCITFITNEKYEPIGASCRNI